MELKLLRKLQENRLLQLTGDAMATGEAIITGEAELRSVQATCDGGIVASWDRRLRRLICWPSS